MLKVRPILFKEVFDLRNSNWGSQVHISQHQHVFFQMKRSWSNWWAFTHFLTANLF